jgi:hypothetical protein
VICLDPAPDHRCLLPDSRSTPLKVDVVSEKTADRVITFATGRAVAISHRIRAFVGAVMAGRSERSQARSPSS